MLDVNASLTEWVIIMEGKGAYDPALQWLKDLGDITITEGMQAMMDQKVCEPGWVGWAWTNARNDVPRELAQLFLIKACEDPTVAAELYINTPDLSALEKQYLWNKFSKVLTSIAHNINVGHIEVASNG